MLSDYVFKISIIQLISAIIGICACSVSLAVPIGSYFIGATSFARHPGGVGYAAYGHGHYNSDASPSVKTLLGINTVTSPDKDPDTTEDINLEYGTYMLHYTDVNIPVSSDLSIKLGRTYTSDWFNSIETPWHISAPYITDSSEYHDPGSDWEWYVPFTGPTYISDDGYSHSLLAGGRSSNYYITPDYSGVTYLGGDTGYEMISPQGLIYKFSQHVCYDRGNPESPSSCSYFYSNWYLTSISDTHFNHIDYHYISNDEVGEIDAYAGGKLVDTVKINYQSYPYTSGGTISSQNLPISIVVNGKTLMTYDYIKIATQAQYGKHWNDGQAETYALKSATLADGRSWQYSYTTVDTGGQSEYQNGDEYGGTIYYLSSVKHPSGEITNYTESVFQPISRMVNASTDIPVAESYMLTHKETVDPDGDKHEWSYTFLGASGGTRSVRTQTPDGAVIDDTYGDLANDYLWRHGQLLKRVVYRFGDLDSPYEEIDYNWVPQVIGIEQSSIEYVPGAYDDRTIYSDKWSNVPQLSSESITRDGTTYTTTYSDYDTYGNPGTIVQTGDQGLSRTAKLTYFTNTGNNILHKLATLTIDGKPVINRTYDSQGDMLTDSRYGLTTTYTYDLFGNVATKTDPNGNVTTYTSTDIPTYNGYVAGIPKQIVHPDGGVIKQTINPEGTIASRTDANGNTTSYTYDAMNRLTSITPPAPRAPTTISYSVVNNHDTVTRIQGNLKTITTLNGWGKPICIEKIDTNTSSPSDISQYIEYNADGSIYWKSDWSNANEKQLHNGANVGTLYDYDPLGRLIKVTRLASDGASSLTTTYDFTTNHQVVKTDPLGNKSTSTYQSYGEPSEKYMTNLVAPAGDATIFNRDSLGNLLSVVHGDLTKTYSYNANNQLISVNNPETGLTKYTKDADGNMLSRQVGSSGVTNFTYNNMNQLTGITYPSGKGTVTKTYDKNGNVLTEDKGDISWSYAYDANDQITDAILTVPNSGTATSQFELKYTYDNLGYISSITYPDGYVFNETHDAFGRLIAGGSSSNGDDTISAIYHPNGLLDRLDYTYNLRYDEGLDIFNRPDIISMGEYPSSTSDVLEYYYDLDNNINTIKYSDSTSIAPLFQDITYSADGQLLSFKGADDYTYTYDVYGNILSSTDASQPANTFNYTYDPKTDLLTSISGSKINKSYTYDAYGDVTGDGVNTYSYNDDGNLVSATAPKGTETFEYDSRNLRAVTNHIDGTVTYSVYGPNGLLLYEDNPKAGWYKDNIYLQGHKVEQRTTHTVSDTTDMRYFMNDIFGSVVEEFGPQLFLQNKYTPWGDRIADKDDTYNTQWFTGKQEDKNLGIDYSGARYYDPTIGRFLSPDPQGFSESNPLTFNEYMYANDNPYKFIDPTGWYSWSQFWQDMSHGFMIGMSFGVGDQHIFTSHFVYQAGITSGCYANAALLATGAREVWWGAEATDAAIEKIGTESWATEEAESMPEGVVYQRLNPEENTKYIGQSKSWSRYMARQKEHDAALSSSHDYSVLDRANPGVDLDVAEESQIRLNGGLRSRGGELVNKRHQMSDERYRANGGDVDLPYDN